MRKMHARSLAELVNMSFLLGHYAETTKA